MKKYLIILLFLCTLAMGTQLSFNSGQLSEMMKYRVDTDKRTMGAEELENVLIRASGMAFKRPGSEFVDDANSTSNVRLIPFEYAANDAYMIEFGHEYISFFRTTE